MTLTDEHLQLGRMRPGFFFERKEARLWSVSQ
jgi:hypothetical protein